MKPNLIIFDFDGVLVNTQEAVNKIEWQYLSQHGMKMTFAHFAKKFSGATAFSIIEALKKKKNITLSKSSGQFAEEIDEIVLTKLSSQKIEAFAGVKKVLQNLPFKKCVASNCSLRILRILLTTSTLLAYFNSNIFSADMVRRPKPYPDLFLFAAHSMGVEPGQCLVIEDSVVGIKAAVAAGMKAWGFLGGHHFKSETADQLLKYGAERTFAKMNNLVNLLNKENTMLTSSANESDFSWQRMNMVKSQIELRGIKDKRVLKSMKMVPRHLFVPDGLKDRAYTDSPLPIGYEQTISQPYIVAFMCEAACISPQEKVLEIGTGSGYQAAVLSLLAQKVYTIEIVVSLGKLAQEHLEDLGYKNVHVKIGDGYSGWPEHAPYDAILITAAAEKVPQPLIDQLTVNGRLIMPLGSGYDQQLVRFIKTKTGLKKELLGPVLFVPFQRDPL
ncbi:MAG: protein-L-isoaspartate(D-aspartate) O-methyltransferase [Alphaproteobacteria bacterium]|nr:protein-L-isoaspartate(D-aspartate) O-methyltransferase [Alphaproteobacteria bacterium]